MKQLIASLLLCSLPAFSLTAQTTIFEQDFQDGIPGATWSIVVNDTNTVHPSVAEFAPGWIALQDPDNENDTVAGATSYFETPGRADRWLITPSILLGAYGNIVKWEGRSHDPSHPDGYYVLISTTDTQLSSFTDTLTTVLAEPEFWTTHEVNLSDSGYNAQSVFIAFVLRTYDAFKLYLDDISLRVEDPVGLWEQSKSAAIVYPNPAIDRIYVKDFSLKSVRIFTIAGQLISVPEIENNTFTVSELLSGSYIVELTDVNGIVARQRFIKN